MKKKIGIFLIIVVTIVCVLVGIRVRKVNAIVITQMQTTKTGSLSYMVETKRNNIIMIDGGSKEDAENLEKKLIEKGGVVDRWYITVAHEENFGALQKIIENGNIEIRNIYYSFNDEEWYQKYEPNRLMEINDLYNTIEEKEMEKVFQDIPYRYELLIDDLYITALNLINPDFNESNPGYNQSMVIEFNNTYKSVIFMGSIANQAAKNCKNNNLDHMNCDAVQVSNNGSQYVDEEIYKIMSPDYLLMSVPTEDNQENARTYIEKLKNLLKSKQTYLSCDGDVTLTIW